MHSAILTIHTPRGHSNEQLHLPALLGAPGCEEEHQRVLGWVLGAGSFSGSDHRLSGFSPLSCLEGRGDSAGNVPRWHKIWIKDLKGKWQSPVFAPHCRSFSRAWVPGLLSSPQTPLVLIPLAAAVGETPSPFPNTARPPWGYGGAKVLSSGEEQQTGARLALLLPGESDHGQEAPPF